MDINVDRNIFSVLNKFREPPSKPIDKPIERSIPREPGRQGNSRPLRSRPPPVNIGDSDAPPSKRFRKNPPSSKIENALKAKPVTPPLAIAEVLPTLKNKYSMGCSSTEKPSVDSVKLPKKSRLLAERVKVEAVTIGNGVFVAPCMSGGLGLFAGKDFKNNAFITLYDGERKQVTDKEREELFKTIEGWSHARSISRHEVICGLKIPDFNRGGGSFTNHGLYGRNKPNSCFKKVEKNSIASVYLQATKEIKCGHEILIDYGKNYWERFKDVLPSEHKRIFVPDLIDAIKKIEHKLELLENLNNIKWLTTHLKNTVPVPNWPELKKKHQEWSKELSRYALFKMGFIQGNHLSLASLRLLKLESNEYFFAIAQFALKNNRGVQTVADWNIRSGSPMIPRHAIFKPGTKKWSVFHFNIFAYIYDHDHFDNKGKALMHTIGMLDPSNPIYEQLLTEYIFRYLDINSYELGNSKLSITKKMLNLLVEKLNHSSSKPLEFLAGHKMPLSGKWSLYYMREFLFRKGVNLEGKRYYPSQINDLMDDKPFYKNAFLLFCRERNCDFQAIFNVTRKEGIRFVKTEGLTFEKQNCNVSALFLQYIHHAGFDYQEVLNSASTEMLRNCINIIQAEYQGPVSIKLLLSLALTNGISDKYGKELIRKYKSRLPENYESSNTIEVYQELKKEGEGFRQKIKYSLSSVSK